MRLPQRPGPLFLLTLFFVATTGVWLILNRSPPPWDDAWYFTNSLALFDALDGGLPAYAKAYLSMLRIKPPLITVLPTPIYLLFGREPKLPVFSIQAVSAYLLSLMNSGVSAYYTLLALVLLPFRTKNRSLILTLWALPFALFLFAPNKDLRLVAPILPVLSLFIASALVKVTR